MCNLYFKCSHKIEPRTRSIVSRLHCGTSTRLRQHNAPTAKFKLNIKAIVWFGQCDYIFLLSIAANIQSNNFTQKASRMLFDMWWSGATTTCVLRERSRFLLRGATHFCTIIRSQRKQLWFYPRNICFLRTAE